ncbi:hypothetical protein DB30_00838 [Enhygromyxa salina]|uniref:Uncharacterized protein n=1 Tax=Enhygromyxa salina TaxID=215803 RepID=A0A0C1Z5R7_9BACT|nr:hypothetical protein [Enhygromyxa salina]KIG12954.1 hypothetical protein DB30_00838 [Enhygromyxa salina]
MSEPEPRCVHYQFVHVALRTLVFQEPRLATALWELDDPGPLLDDIALQVVRACRGRGEGGEIRADQLTLHKLRLGGYPCMILEMPEPIATTEAYMLAILGRPSLGGAEQAEGEDDGRARYFTLEHSSHRPAPHTVLGEWTGEGSHLNMGGGPEPSVEAFVAELARFVLD